MLLSVLSGILEGAALVAILPLLQSTLPGIHHDRAIRVAGATVKMSPGEITAIALILFCLVGAASSFCRFASETKGLRVKYDAEERMRSRLTTLLLDTRWTALVSLRAGEVATAVLVDPARASEGLLAFLRVLSSGAVTAVFVAAAAALSVRLTLFTLVFGALGVLVYRVITARAESRMQALSAVADEIGNQISDTFTNLKYFRSGGFRDAAKAVISGTYRDYADGNVDASRYGILLRFVLELAGVVFITAILGAAVATSGGLTPSAIVFLAIFYRLAPRLMSLQDQLHSARVSLPWWESWRSRAQYAIENQEAPTSGLAPTFRSRLSVEGVSFRYPGTSALVLSGVSFDIPAGGFVAVVGASGSGKTTLLDVVTGLLRPTSGSVKLDGVPISEVDIEQWQSRIGLVMQESPLFHASVVQNVTVNDERPDLARVHECLDLADARSFVTELPHGLDTVIGERGGRLSGGQRQRLALARALYRKPWLLVLDEPTSALDGETELAILGSLEKLKGVCPVLMVSHRLNTVRFADHILVLDRGRVVEEGRWADLVGQSGSLFAGMASRQDISGGAET